MRYDTHEEWAAQYNAPESWEKTQQRLRAESMPLYAMFYDREADAYFNGNGDEL